VATSIVFNDGSSVTLTNSKPTPGDRLSGWTPLTENSDNGAGIRRFGLGTGTAYAWTFRTDYGARFMLRHIPKSDTAKVMRLKRHLEGGGQVTVNTGDSASNSYTCTLWPGSRVEVSPPDEDQELTVTLAVRNTVSQDAVCLY
jgi:hypothetical protein